MADLGDRPAFAIGDPVHITGPRHPWKGQHGWIVERLACHGFDWTVELPDQGGHHCGVAEKDIRKGRG